MTLLTQELLSWIGRQIVYHAPDALGAASFRYFALALQDDNPIYHDQNYAAASRHGGVIAPPTLVCETNQIVRQKPNADGYIGHHWDLPIGNGRFIRGGNEYEFHQPVRPDDRVDVTWTLLDIYERPSKQNGRLVFVISEARYVNQRGELLATNRETNIYAP